MSLPRFRLVQGKAIGERSTPGVSTPEPAPPQIKQEVDYQDAHQMAPEPVEAPQAQNHQMQPPRQPIQQQMQHSQSPSPMAPQGPPGTPQNSAAAAAAASDDKNVTKCVRFLKTLINLSNNDDPEMPDKAARVKELIRGVIYLETTAEEFTRNLQQVLKSQAQPHLLPFLQNTLPALRNAVRNGTASVEGVNPPPGYVFNNGRTPGPPQPPPPQQQSQQQPPLEMRQIPNPNQIPPQMVQGGPHMVSVGARPMIRPMGPGGPSPMGLQGPVRGPMGHQMVQMHPPPPPQQIQQQHPAPPVEMEVEENLQPTAAATATRQYPEGSLKSSILKPDEVLNRITKRMMSSCSVEEEALVAISDAVESHLRELITLMAGVAEHRVESLRIPENYVAIDDVKRQLRFLEDLDRQEEELRESREKESLIRMSKNKNSGKETIEKAKEMQRQDAEAKRNRDANAAAIAALSSNKTVKNKWENTGAATTAPRPRTVRVTTRDLHLLVNQDSRFTGTFIREKMSYGGPAVDTTI